MVTVIKVGGSLLDWPGLFPALAELLPCCPRPLLIAGGGAAADVVREWDQTFALGEARAHALALESLRLTAALLADRLPGAVIVNGRDGAESVWREVGVPVLDLPAFLQAEEPDCDDPLPRCWDATTDSIAAWIAWRWPAELLLLKSTSPQQATAAAFVDPLCHRWIGRLQSGSTNAARWQNLRTGECGQFSRLS